MALGLTLALSSGLTLALTFRANLALAALLRLVLSHRGSIRIRRILTDANGPSRRSSRHWLVEGRTSNLCGLVVPGDAVGVAWL